MGAYYLDEKVQHFVLDTIALLVLLAICAACSNFDVSIKPYKVERSYALTESPTLGEPVSNISSLPKNMPLVSKQKPKERILGTLALRYDVDHVTKTVNIDLRKENSGYFAEAPIINNDKFRTSLAIGMQKESRMFVGLKMRWSF